MYQCGPITRANGTSKIGLVYSYVFVCLHGFVHNVHLRFFSVLFLQHGLLIDAIQNTNSIMKKKKRMVDFVVGSSMGVFFLFVLVFVLNDLVTVSATNLFFFSFKYYKLLFGRMRVDSVH